MDKLAMAIARGDSMLPNDFARASERHAIVEFIRNAATEYGFVPGDTLRLLAKQIEMGEHVPKT